jgi:hypothetical protein
MNLMVMCKYLVYGFLVNGFSFVVIGFGFEVESP